MPQSADEASSDAYSFAGKGVADPDDDSEDEDGEDNAESSDSSDFVAADGSSDEEEEEVEDREEDDDEEDDEEEDGDENDDEEEDEEEEEDGEEDDDEEEEEEEDSDGYEEDEDKVDKGKSSVKFDLYLQSMNGRLEAAKAEVVAVRQQAADEKAAAQLQADEFAKMKEELTVYRARDHKQAKSRRKQQEMFRSKLKQVKKMKKMKKMKESLKRKPEPPLTGRKKTKRSRDAEARADDLFYDDPLFRSPKMATVKGKGKGKIGGKAKVKSKGEGKGKGTVKGKIKGKCKGAGKGVGKGESKSGRPPFGAFDAETSTFQGSSAEADQKEALEKLEAIQDTEVYENSPAFAKTVHNVFLEVDPDYIFPESSSSADADKVALVSDCLANVCSPKRGKRCFTQAGECDKDGHDEQGPRRALEMRARVSVKGDESGTSYMLFANILRTLIPREEKGRVKAKFQLKAGDAVPHFDMIREIEGRRWAVTFSNKKKDQYVNITKLVAQDD